MEEFIDFSGAFESPEFDLPDFEEPEIEAPKENIPETKNTIKNTQADAIFEESKISSYEAKPEKKEEPPKKKPENKTPKKEAASKPKAQEKPKKVVSEEPKSKKNTTKKEASGKPKEQENPKEPEKPKDEKTTPENTKAAEPPKQDKTSENTTAENTVKEEQAREEQTKRSYNMDFDADQFFSNMNNKEVYGEEDIEIIDPQPQEQPQVEYIPPKPKTGKKIFVFAAMLMCMIGIPLIITLAGRKEKTSSIIPQASQIMTSQGATEQSTLFYCEAKKQTENALGDVKTSTRFANLDELTLYLNSNTGAALSNETQIVNMFDSGLITAEVLQTQMQEYISQANELNHLLLVNNQTYANAGRQEEYNTLKDNIDTLLIYGDTAIYNAVNKAK